MSNTKRGISLILSLLMIVSMITLFSGCGNKSDNSGTSEYVYVPTFTKISGDNVDSLGSCLLVNNELYYYATIYNGESGPILYTDAAKSYVDTSTAENTDSEDPEAPVDYDYSTRTVIGKISMDGKATELFEVPTDEIPENCEGGGCYINGFGVNSKGDVAYLLNTYSYYYDLPDDFNGSEYDKWNYEVYTNSYRVVFCDSQGNIKAEANIGEYVSEDSYVSGFVLGEDGKCYLVSDQTIIVLDESLNKLYEVTGDDWFYESLRLNDGSLGVTSYTDDGYKLFKINNDTKQLEEVCKMPSDYNSIYVSSGEYSMLYTTGVYLYGVKSDSGEKEKILNWISCDIDSSYISSVCALEDGKILAVTSDWTGDEVDNELVVLTKTKASDVAQKKVLTYATQSLNYDLKSAIIKFNKTNNDYRIEVKDYSEFNTDEDYTAGLQKLKTEILSGQIPDIIDMSGLNVEQFVSKGLLEDLLPYVNSDKDLGEGSLVDSFLEAASIDGKLYYACQSYTIYTAAGSSNIFGYKAGVTIGELLELYKNAPEGTTVFDEWTTRSDILYSCLYQDMNYYVDWVNRTCNFDNEQFAQLLEFAKLFPEEYDWENYSYDENSSQESRVASGKQMLSSVYLYLFDDYQYYKAAYGNNVTFVGMPTAEGIGNSFQPECKLAMSSKCADKQAAWEFLRTIYTKDYQLNNAWGFYTNKAAFEKSLKDAMTPNYETDEHGNYVLDDDGNKIEISHGGYGDEFGNVVNYYALTQEEANAVRSIIDNANKILDYESSSSITDIVLEEADAYFNGSKSAADVAKSVQNRVGLYINEQS